MTAALIDDLMSKMYSGNPNHLKQLLHKKRTQKH
jgi:hypothetical protein